MMITQNKKCNVMEFKNNNILAQINVTAFPVWHYNGFFSNKLLYKLILFYN